MRGGFYSEATAIGAVPNRGQIPALDLPPEPSAKSAPRSATDSRPPREFHSFVGPEDNPLFGAAFAR